jgi:hypothetical protein
VLESILTGSLGLEVSIWNSRLGKRGFVLWIVTVCLLSSLIMMARRMSGAIAIGRTEKLE